MSGFAPGESEPGDRAFDMTDELKLAYDHCQRVAKDQAKNFYYAFKTLPPQKRRAIYAAYAFCRICDDIADEDHTLESKRAMLADTRLAFRDAQHNASADPVFLALQDAAKTFDIPQNYFEQIVEGVEMDLSWSRFRNFEELRTYCYKVASVVGLVCIQVFGYEDPNAKTYAIDLGLAMQLTNILRDVKEDADLGRIYIPLDEMERFGYSEQDLMAGVVNDQFRQLMAFQVDRARRYFASGKRLIPLVSSESQACPSVMHGVYSSVLDRIEASNFQVFDKRIGLSTGEKLFLVARLWASARLSRLPILSKMQP